MKIVIFCITAAIVSCSGVDCKDLKNSGSARCSIQNAVIDCTTKAAQDLLAAHLGDISKFFNASGIDWVAIESALEKIAAPEAICVIEKAWDNYFSNRLMLARDSSHSADSANKRALEAKLWPGKSAKFH